MQQNAILYPPNKQLERNLTFSEAPVIHKALFYVDFNRRGEAILGSSNVNGTLWEGTFFSFQDEESLCDFKYSGHYISTTSSDGKFLTDNLVAVAEDTGNLHILNIDVKSNIDTYVFYKHFDRIPQIAVWQNSSKIVSCSGRTLNIIDINSSRNPVADYTNYHTEYINSVDTLKSQANVFVSASMDRKALIWDERNIEPVSVLYANEFGSLTSIAWNRVDEHSVVVGTEGGDVYLFDTREPNNYIEVYHGLKSNIHRFTFNNNNNLLALCGDTNEVKVVDCSEKTFNKIYENSEHDGIVRGLAWHEDDLYSTGFDRKIIKHKI